MFRLVLPTIIAMVFFAGCFEKPTCLELSISSSKEVYDENEMVNMNIKFQNHCRRDVVVIDPSWDFAPISCEFRDLKGNPPDGILYKIAPPNFEEYISNQVLLHPEQEYGAQRATNYKWGAKYLDLHSGTYIHWCEYNLPKRIIGTKGEILHPPAVRGPLKSKFWFGHIKSNTVNIIIKSSSTISVTKK